VVKQVEEDGADVTQSLELGDGLRLRPCRDRKAFLSCSVVVVNWSHSSLESGDLCALDARKLKLEAEAAI
jgi:hypothetical protein